MSALVGREREVAAIDAALSDARAGRGGIIVLTGEPGIGKSRLAQEALDRAAAAGMVTARGFALDDPGAPPLWPWRRIARALPGVAAALAGSVDIGSDAAARFGLFEAVADEVTSAAATSGLAVLLEDMHWSDAASIQLVRHLAADLPTRRSLLILTARDSQVGAAWSKHLPELLRASGGATSLTLQGLSESAVVEWLRSTPEGAEWIPYAEQLRRRTNGNPLYLDMVTSEPPGADGGRALDVVVARRSDLRAVVTANMAALSPLSRRAVEAAALLGERVSIGVLADVVDASVTDIFAVVTEATAAGVLRDTDVGPAFTHALVRDGVIAEIPPGRRSDLHRAIALALEAASDDRSAGLIAEHWRLAEGSDATARCVLWSRRAADIAATGFAPDNAVAHAELALQQARDMGAPAEQLCEITVELAERQMVAGDLRGALQSCHCAADLAERTGRADLLARAALVIGGVGDLDLIRAVNGLTKRAMVALPDGDNVLRARLLAQQAVAAAEHGGGQGAAELAALAVAAARESMDPTAELEALAARHLSITVPQTLDEREQIAARAIDLGRSATDPMASLWGHLWMADAHFQRGHLDGVDQELSDIESIAVRRRFPLARWHAHRIRAARAVLQGDFDLAHRLNEESLELALRMDDSSMVGVAHAFTVILATIRGDPSRVSPEVLPMFRNGPPLPLLRALLAIVLALFGESAEARGIVEELRGVVEELPVGPRWVGTLGMLGLAATLVGDKDAAELVYDRLQTTAGTYDGDGSSTIVSTGSTARAVGELALLTGRADEAVGLFASAVQANSRLGAHPFVALSRLGWARALRVRAGDGTPTAGRSRDDLPMAVELARQAAAEFRRLDMPGPLRAADRLLQQLADDVRRHNPLTAREWEIAALIAEDMSNKQIATRLVLSERTVESHVRNILMKLGVTGRAAIARWVRG